MRASSTRQAFFTRAPTLLAAAEFDLPGEWEQPDFDDESGDEADEDDGRPCLQMHRQRRW